MGRLTPEDVCFYLRLLRDWFLTEHNFFLSARFLIQGEFSESSLFSAPDESHQLWCMMLICHNYARLLVKYLEDEDLKIRSCAAFYIFYDFTGTSLD